MMMRIMMMIETLQACWSDLCNPMATPSRRLLGLVVGSSLAVHIAYTFLVAYVFKRATDTTTNATPNPRGDTTTTTTTTTTTNMLFSPMHSRLAEGVDVDDSVFLGLFWCFIMAALVGFVLVSISGESLHFNDILLIILALSITLSFLSFYISWGSKNNANNADNADNKNKKKGSSSNSNSNSSSSSSGGGIGIGSRISLLILNPLCLICWLPVFNGLWDSTFDAHVDNLLSEFKLNSLFILAILVNSSSLIRLTIGLQEEFISKSSVVNALSLGLLLTIYAPEITALLRNTFEVTKLNTYINIVAIVGKDASHSGQFPVSYGRLLMLGGVFVMNVLLVIILNKFHIFFNSKLDYLISGVVVDKTQKNSSNSSGDSISNSDSSNSSSSNIRRNWSGSSNLKGLSIPPDDKMVPITREQAELLMENKLDITELELLRRKKAD